MDFLFDNPLATMYGPEFLVLYSIFIVFTVLGYSFLKNKLDETDHLPLPLISTNPDPFEIAYLRGGANELARAVVFSLTRKDLLKFSNDGKTSLIYPTGTSFDKRNLTPIEQTALGWFGTTRNVKEIFQKTGLSEALKPHYEMYQARLELENLLPAQYLINRNNSLALKACLIFCALGLYKIIAAVANGYSNIFGIILVTLIGMLVLAWAKKMPRLTRLGEAYLERLQFAFQRLKAADQTLKLNDSQPAGATAFSAIDPLILSVGVFGGSILAGTVYNDYNEAFQKAQNHSSVNSSSCGSGCGSASCSSGGDSGGSTGCSSGCGGCGGGGGCS